MNKKLLKIGSAISILNFTAPIVTNATTYRITTITSRKTNINTTSGTPASILSKLHKNRALGNTITLSSPYSHERQIFYPKPERIPYNNKFRIRYSTTRIPPN